MYSTCPHFYWHMLLFIISGPQSLLDQITLFLVLYLAVRVLCAILDERIRSNSLISGTSQWEIDRNEMKFINKFGRCCLLLFT